MADCLRYLKEEFIPATVSTGELENPRLHRILCDETEEAVNYALQFSTKDIATLEFWLERRGAELQQKLVKEFGPQIIGFATRLEEIEL